MQMDCSHIFKSQTSPPAQEVPLIELQSQCLRDEPMKNAPTANETQEGLAEARFATLKLLRLWFPEAGPRT